MAYAVDPRVLVQQSPCSEPVPDLAEGDAGRQELVVCNDAVGFVSELCEYLFYRPVCMSHCDMEAGRFPISPPVDGSSGG